MYAASIARTSSFGRNGFCRHITSESSGDAETKSSVVIPDGDDRQIWNALTHHPDDVETVDSMQKDIDDREIEFGISNFFSPAAPLAASTISKWLTRSTIEIIARTSDWSSITRMRGI